MKKQLFALFLLCATSHVMIAKDGKVKNPGSAVKVGTTEQKETSDKKPKIAAEKKDTPEAKAETLRQKALQVDAALHSFFALVRSQDASSSATLSEDEKNELRQIQRSLMSSGDKEFGLELNKQIVKNGADLSEDLEQRLIKAKQAIKEYNAVAEKKDSLPPLHKDDTLSIYKFKIQLLDKNIEIENLKAELNAAVGSQGKQVVFDEINAAQAELNNIKETIKSIKENAEKIKSAAKLAAKKAEAAMKKAAANAQKEADKAAKAAAITPEKAAKLAEQAAKKEQDAADQKAKADQKAQERARIDADKQERRELAGPAVKPQRTNARRALTQAKQDEVAPAVS